MAKVMVSLPDELLGPLDAERRAVVTSRSALLRHYVDEGLRRRAEERIRHIETLMSAPGHHGGRGAEELKRYRPER